jgi:hypothetical protein
MRNVFDQSFTIHNWNVKEKRTKVVPARFAESEFAVLQKLADKRGLGLSPMLRLAFLDYARRNGELLPESPKSMGR